MPMPRHLMPMGAEPEPSDRTQGDKKRDEGEGHRTINLKAFMHSNNRVVDGCSMTCLTETDVKKLHMLVF